MQITLTIFSVAAFVTTSHANELHVQKQGTGVACTEEDPCGSIGEAISQSNPGDTILIGKGLFIENVSVPTGKDGIKLVGQDSKKTVIASAGGNAEQQVPKGVLADIALDIAAKHVEIKSLAIVHPEQQVTKRDIGIYLRPSAMDASIEDVKVERKRIGDTLEPFNPGSRGLLAIHTSGARVSGCMFKGAYEDHIHLETMNSTVENNYISGASRAGIVVIQDNPSATVTRSRLGGMYVKHSMQHQGSEPEDAGLRYAKTLGLIVNEESPFHTSSGNRIVGNLVESNGSDGIQIQGRDNVVLGNKVRNNGGQGIHICGPTSKPACIAPGTSVRGSHNQVSGNKLKGNSLGDIADHGVATSFVVSEDKSSEGGENGITGDPRVVEGTEAGTEKGNDKRKEKKRKEAVTDSLTVEGEGRTADANESKEKQQLQILNAYNKMKVEASGVSTLKGRGKGNTIEEEGQTSSSSDLRREEKKEKSSEAEGLTSSSSDLERDEKKGKSVRGEDKLTMASRAKNARKETSASTKDTKTVDEGQKEKASVSKSDDKGKGTTSAATTEVKVDKSSKNNKEKEKDSSKKVKDQKENVKESSNSTHEKGSKKAETGVAIPVSKSKESSKSAAEKDVNNAAEARSGGMLPDSKSSKEGKQKPANKYEAFSSSEDRNPKEVGH